MLIDAVNHAYETVNNIVYLLSAAVPPDPNLPDSNVVPESNEVVIPRELREDVGNILGLITWVVFGCAMGGVLFCGIRVAIAYKDGGEVLAPGLLSPLIACGIAASASGIIKIVT